VSAELRHLDPLVAVLPFATLTLIPSPATAGEGREPSALRATSFTREVAYA